jgi:hypothetical protein
VGAKNILNTFDCTYEKDMVSDPSITIYLHLSPEELDSIHLKMQQIDFFNYPDIFRINVTNEFEGIVTPFSTYYFYIQTENLVKELYWEDKIINPDHKAEQLRELIHLILKIIHSEKEYQQLPESRGGYLL